MSPIVVISVAAAGIGVLAGLLARRRVVVVSGAILVVAAVVVLVWSRPSTARSDAQATKVESLCKDVAFALFDFDDKQQIDAYRKDHPWSEQAIVWLGLAAQVHLVEPLCFPESPRPCFPAAITASAPASYDVVKPHLARVLRAFDKHTGCGPIPSTTADVPPASR